MGDLCQYQIMTSLYLRRLVGARELYYVHTMTSQNDESQSKKHVNGMLNHDPELLEPTYTPYQTSL